MMVWRKASFLFTAAIFLFVLLFFSISLTYDETDRLVPLVVLTPALVMSLFCVMGEFFPKLLARTSVDMIGAGDEKVEAATCSGKLVGRRGILIVTGWILGLCFLILLAGFYIAIPVALFLFLKSVAGYSWFKAVAITVITLAFVYGMFGVLMKFDLYRGVLFGRIVMF